MKKTTRILLLLLFITASTMYGQTLSGTVVDETNQPLPGADVVLMGTTKGTSTDFNGNFSLDVDTQSGTVTVSFIGYNTKTLTFSGSTDFGKIALVPSTEALDEIVITQTSYAIDRKTPVAVSTIRASEIENKLGTQEFPEILKSTPGVYATKSGGGFGDGRLNLRGFNSENVAVMINGVPVNDMENGRVYWSNWAGLADVTSAMQVQRGLGASKVAVPSIGGTVNILSKTTDVEKGGNFFTAVGNDGYQKYGATVSTGLLDSGFAVTVSASKTKGNGYVDGTEFEGYNYFVNVSKEINENHKLSITSFGAPQRHGQRQDRSTIERYRNSESGIKFNPNWGIKNGEVVHVEDNFYHKSQTSLNHYWTINDKSSLSTALYASWGTGGGGGTAGDTGLFSVRLGDSDQPIDLDNIVEINRARGAEGFGSQAYLRASRNDHSWFGALSTFKTDLSDNLALIAGIDLRTYTGKHFREITDLLGGTHVEDNSNDNNPNAVLKVGDKFSYYNDGEVGWQGVFAQLEYDNDNLSAFVSTSLSNTSYKRIDYFQYLTNDPLRETDKYNFGGFGIKGGVNYRLDGQNNVFANIGYFEKAAGFDAVFVNFNNEDINEDAENQKIFSAELGYGFRGEKFSANLNLYHTKWNDRTYTDNFSIETSPDVFTEYFANLTGVNALHQGIELDFIYKPSDKLTLTGMASLGNWEWTDNLENVQVYDENQVAIGDPYSLHIKGLKVADAAQTTAALGLDYELMERTHFTVDYNYFGNIYADFDPNSRGVSDIAELANEAEQAWEMPDYGTFDASIRYGFNLAGFDATLTGRMNNVFNTEYISDALDGSNHSASDALVWYGYGRTFNISAKIKF
ncbi:TonB-dependent receptor [Urechidicola croceus]|uniref:TonB-dependent receptor n=1 Tax=Urechidicola croceus TaxID=1850246 RepID=A0A1D8P9X0_9FLAO|nr:carboxypeptidase-like regulatory domain-containing protein [Urechidicola croceus]AOW21363.1 TonB-dependent receptor [Urechidicola croceus]